MKSTGYNSTYPKVVVQWLNQALYFYQSFCFVDSEVLRNQIFKQEPKRWFTFLNDKKHKSSTIVCYFKRQDNANRLY